MAEGTQSRSSEGYLSRIRSIKDRFTTSQTGPLKSSKLSRFSIRIVWKNDKLITQAND